MYLNMYMCSLLLCAYVGMHVCVYLIVDMVCMYMNTIHVHINIHRHAWKSVNVCEYLKLGTWVYIYSCRHACEYLHLRHSGIIHFSASTTSAPQMEPSDGGIFTILSRLFMPSPQVALHISHSPHSVTRQLLGATPVETYTVHITGV